MAQAIKYLLQRGAKKLQLKFRIIKDVSFNYIPSRREK
jgi:hypothetical protein